MTLEQLCKKVRIVNTPGARLAWDKQDEWQRNARGWTCKLSYSGRSMTVNFWQGMGIREEPTAFGVLDCLLSDASTYDNASSFSDWCGELGFNEDSRRAEKIYKSTGRQTEKLRKLLGDDYEEFLYAER